MKIYNAVYGDTWDSIAYKTVGNEFMCDAIRKENATKYSNVVMFEGGEKIAIPENIKQEVKIIKTPWEG